MHKIKSKYKHGNCFKKAFIFAIKLLELSYKKLHFCFYLGGWILLFRALETVGKTFFLGTAMKKSKAY